MAKILFFNPRSGIRMFRVPNSILQIAASIEGRYEWAFVEGNRESDPYGKLRSYLETGEYPYVGFTVMPGPQLRQAIPFAKKIREEFPEVKMIWGGYFPSTQPKTVLNSGYVDFVINGPGDHAFPKLIEALERGTPVDDIKNLIFRVDGKIVKTPKEDLIDQSTLPPLPYDTLHKYYSMDNYLGTTYLGKRTLAYHSSIGCPFTCSFCAVVPIYEARWKAKTARQVYDDIKYIKDRWGADAIEFHDNNFFVSEKRVVEFCHLIKGEKMIWWGEGRIDTMDKFSDDTLSLLRESGCKMIFFGAESGNDQTLKAMDKGGKQSGAQIRAFAARMARFDIIPEYSFVLGVPAETPEKALELIEGDISFIKEIKSINPKTEIVIYTYSPVPTEGSELFKRSQEKGFRYPEHLEDWISPAWENFDLRKNPATPWMTAAMMDRIRGFETVLNGYYPTVADIRLNNLKRRLIRSIAQFRYKNNLFWKPYEIKLLHKVWRYRQPEIQGF